MVMQQFIKWLSITIIECLFSLNLFKKKDLVIEIKTKTIELRIFLKPDVDGIYLSSGTNPPHTNDHL